MRSNHELITAYDERLIQVRIPVPLALKSVNSYLLKDGDDYVWIDPGLNTKHIQDIWANVFTQLSIKPQHISKIICTHQHPDHFGLAGYAQHLTKAPVYMSHKSFNYANLLWKEEHSFPELLQSLFFRHGVPSPLISSIVENLHWFRSLVYPFPELTFVNHLDIIDINNEQWQYIETSGHAKGQMMLYDARTKTMICGDQVLPHITPHVGVVPSEEDERPLEQFLDCLKQLKIFEVDKAYAGHGESFSNWTERIENIVVHHERRLIKMRSIIDEHGQLNAFEMSNLVFGQHLHKQPQNLRFAITEIIAHMDSLADQGHIIKKEMVNAIIYISKK